MKPADMLHQMCHVVLAGTDVKALCKARGFPAQAASSRGVLETLFLSSQGLSQAFNSLERNEIALLHLLKHTGPVDVSFFSGIYGGKHAYGTFSQRYQSAFTKAKQRLVRSGVLLLAEARQAAWEKKTKMERWRFALPAEFHEHLPPLIQSPSQLAGAGTWKPNVVRDQIHADLGRSPKKAGDAVFQIQAGELCLSGQRFEAKKLAGWQQSGWKQAVGGDKGKDRKDSYCLRPDEAALCILSDLPDGHWADAEQLAEPLRIFCGKKVDSEAVCDAGVEWGLLAKHRVGGKPCYRLAPDPPSPALDEYLASDRQDVCVAVDLTKVPFEALERIVAISDQRVDPVRKTRLLITPDFVKLGRADDHLLAAEPIPWLVEHTQPFAEAAVALAERRGKTILHQNVCVARVSDLTLKVAIEKALGSNLVSLKNDFIAFPNGSLDDVRRVVKKSGHVVKEISRAMNIDQFKNASSLDIETYRPDIRRDLHVFIDYVCEREVKRAHRDNSLSKADAKRLAKLLSDPEAMAEVEQEGYSSWIHFVDRFALQLGLIHYDTQGTYAGYTSREPCYPDNYIEFDAKAYEKLSSMKLADQEQQLLESLLNDNQGNSSEFYGPFFSSRSDGFNHQGSATGVMPMLDFAASRRFLLELLADCPVGQWLSVESLVAHLKKHHRYFLIPKKPQFKKEWDRKYGRYGNFYESKERWGADDVVQETDADAFERVEGRYVERFLENIPHLLGYVDVAYAKQRPQGVYPVRGLVKAFRVSDRLNRALHGKIAEPTLKATPNFDLYVQSEFYPARLMHALAPICELKSEDTTTVFRLERQKVASACAADSKLDVIRLLESLATEPLPANVRRELSEWSAHSDKFVLYGNCSLLETNSQSPDLKRFRVERIAKGTDIVRSPAKLFEELEKQELAPLRIKHAEHAFTPLPAKTRSQFPRKAAGKKRAGPKTKVTLMRVTQVQLLCPNSDVLQRLQGLLAEAACPVEADRKRLSLAYSSQHEKEVSRAIRALKKEFEVKINDQ